MVTPTRQFSVVKFITLALLYLRNLILSTSFSRKSSLLFACTKLDWQDCAKSIERIKNMFWEKFVTLCNKKCVKPNNVTKELGLSTASATQWKHGSIPRDAQLNKIADYFGVPMSYFKEDETTAKAAQLAIKMARNPKLAEEIEKRGVRIPVYGNVAAGIPLEAITDIEDYEEISQEMAAKGEYAALRIHGDSMEPRMTDGDVVIVRLQDSIESGEIAIVMINGGTSTCKKVMLSPDGITLISTNERYGAMFYSNQQIEELPVRIWGKVVELRAKF